MFKKILIANRGEIVIRVIRACKELNIKTVAIYSEVDRNSLHVMLADEAYYIGPAESRFSYLNIEKIIEVAVKAGVDAIHPGYGFLSESPPFARACLDANIQFIGPSPEVIEAMGDKINARKIMESLGVPITPGVNHPLKNLKEASEAGENTGYPIILKASRGGGGKGIRVVQTEKDMPKAFKSCQLEAKKKFGKKDIFIEKFIPNSKHIEVQVLADHHGKAVHLFERECSIQRRHQKLIEESPSPKLPSRVRKKMTKLALKVTKKIGYTNAGTIEFIYNSEDKKFYFLEMNTRLQVEHPVTELITGVDLVKEQIFISAGHKLRFSQKHIQQKGHAIELRICAEDPKTFLPNPGRIRRCRIPQGPFVRVDAYCYMGYKVPIHYDSLIAKLITWGENRKDCINKLKRALAEFSLTGIKTNIVLHRNILMHENFLDGTYTNNFIEKKLSREKRKELSLFVDERVFLISAAIMAYKAHKKKPSSGSSNLWKQKSRIENLES